LTGTRRHRFDLRFHLAPGRARSFPGGAVGHGVGLAIDGARRIALEDGWISSRYGRREPAPVISAVATGEHASFVTLLRPREPGAPAPILIRDGETLHIGDDVIVLGETVTRRRAR
jgi:hypothetical protein